MATGSLILLHGIVVLSGCSCCISYLAKLVLKSNSQQQIIVSVDIVLISVNQVKIVLMSHQKIYLSDSVQTII